MPRDLTHVILANDMQDRLDGEAKKCAKSHPTAFHMGAVSHDSFLFGSQSKLSTKMHGGFGDDTRDIVLTMLDDVRNEKNKKMAEKKKAFAFGFLSHMAVDSAFHPFVYSVSGSQVRENNPDEDHVKLAKTRHRYVETWLDMHFVEQKGYDFDNFRPLRKIVSNVGERGEMTDFFAKNYAKTFGIKEDLSSVYKNSMTIQLFLGKVTKNQTIGKVLRRLDNFLDGRLGMAASGFYQKDRRIPEKLVDFSSYKHPVTGETVYKTLDNLAQEAVERGVGMMTAAEKYVIDGNKQEFLKAVPNINLDTGVENTKLSDIKQASPVPVSHLKGEKLQKFAASGFKTMASGAKAVKGGRALAHPEVRKYGRNQQEAVSAITRKRVLDR